MELKLFNTLGRTLQVFKPRHDKKVGMYTCGPTVYSTAHIGNLRTYIFEDILRRTLEFNGYQVDHVMNVTDVGHLTSDADEGEDKIEQAAKSAQRSALDIAREHEAEFFHDLDLLNIERPTKVIRATETIEWQIDLIKKLEKNGVTYTTSDGVYFDTSQFPRYGELGGQKLADKKAGARVDVNSEKHNPSDFALWKFSKPEDRRQMEWPSPWGTGFPGWHIECSAMSMHELGDQFDIHCGGVDHIAVHHENEIAQSEAATGKHPWVNYWLHGEFLVTDKRMGKSEGNAVTLQTLQDKDINPLTFRYLCLQTHYRKPLQFTWEALQAAQEGFQTLWGALNTICVGVTRPGAVIKEFVDRVTEALNNDLNTSEALAVIHEIVNSKHDSADIFATLQQADKALGLKLVPVTTLSPELEEKKLARQKARLNKDYKTSDSIKFDFEGSGLTVNDTTAGTAIFPKFPRI